MKNTKKADAASTSEERPAGGATGNSPDLAELISAVLEHPDIPTELYNNIQDDLNSLDLDGADINGIRRRLAKAVGRAMKEKGEAARTQGNIANEEYLLTPKQAAAIVGQWDTNGDEHAGDLILLCRALVHYDREHAEHILDAIEREIVLMSPTIYTALDGLVESRRATWRKGVR